MRKIAKEVREIYLEIKGKTSYQLTTDEKEFLKELQNQAIIMRDFCKPLSRTEIEELINTCSNDVQLEITLRPKKVA